MISNDNILNPGTSVGVRKESKKSTQDLPSGKHKEVLFDKHKEIAAKCSKDRKFLSTGEDNHLRKKKKILP